MSNYTNVIKQPLPQPHTDFIDDAFATAKFSFLVGGAVGLQVPLPLLYLLCGVSLTIRADFERRPT